LLDKYQKLGIETFRDALQELGLEQSALDQLSRFIQSQNAEQLLENFPELENDPGYQQILYLLTTLQDLGYGEWVVFNPSIIRGFDYYAGPNVLNQGTVSLKNTRTGKQVSFSQAALIQELKEPEEDIL
jgi:histidyl-tRNA synthetase